MKTSQLIKTIGLLISGILFIVLLTGCGNKNTADVVSMKGKNITQEQYYKALKQDTNGKTVLQKLIVSKALENEYGDKVSKSDVNKDYETYENQYGDNLASVLKQNNMTKKTFKEQIRTNLLMQQAVKANVKITDKQLKDQFEDYQPNVQVAEITLKTEKEAKKVLKLAQKKDANFAALAKKYSTDTSNLNEGGKLPTFNNMNTTLDKNFTKAAFSLKTGELYKSPVKTSNGYQIIKMIKNPGKGRWQDHVSALKSQIYAKDQQDSKIMKKILSKLFKDTNVKIHDNDVKDALAGY